MDTKTTSISNLGTYQGMVFSHLLAPKNGPITIPGDLPILVGRFDHRFLGKRGHFCHQGAKVHGLSVHRKAMIHDGY
jgi:hypothetical protein